MSKIWDNDNYNKWQIFKEPEYEWQWLYLNNNSNSYETTSYLTDYEFGSRNIGKLYSCYQKLEQSKRIKK